MKQLYKFKFILIFILIFPAKNLCQDWYSSVVADTFSVDISNVYHLKTLTIIPFSEKVKLNQKILDKNQYSFSYSKAEFSLTDTSNLTKTDTIIISYKTITLSLRKNYTRRKLVKRIEEETSDTIKIVERSGLSLSSESIFGSNIHKSGTIVRGFTVGTTKDFSVSSGLRLQLSGKLSDELEIVAALTDKNTPIQPEGNTERLEELDKVFIEVKHKNAVGTFGDYDFINDKTEFGRINRKLQGLKGKFLLDNYTGNVAIASSRGKFNTNQFNGQDGNQGPYRLTGINNERDIIIIAGSERVYIDGEALKRGENNDYTIEYSNAEITFTPNKIITSASRISVDFEYTDRQYKRNFFAAGATGEFFDKRLSVGVNYYQEGDDQNNPIDLTLSDSEKSQLENAGDDRKKASLSGAKLAEPDSNGLRIGTYVKVDTVISGNSFIYYKYNPGDTSAIYNVTFSYVGEGKGDYVKVSLGNYKFAGIGAGSYLPVKYLPLPQLKQFANISVKSEPFKNVLLNAEFGGSSWDKNRFSNLDDSDNFGYARNIFLDIKPREVELGNIKLGKIGLSYKDRFIQNRFASLDRINNIEFDRDYNISANQNSDEELRELGLTLAPLKNMDIYSQYGYLRKGSIKSDRYLNNFKFSDNTNIGFTNNIDYVTSENGNINTDWLRQQGSAYYSFGIVKPGFNILYENKLEEYSSKDSLLNSSLRYFEAAPFVELAGFEGINFKYKYSFREESFPVDGILEKESNAFTHNIQLSYHGIKEVATNLNLAFRNKEYTDVFISRGFRNNETVLIYSQSRFNFWNNVLHGNLYYEVATQKSAKLEKVFIRVAQGTGNYIYLGDLNNNGVAEENEFELSAYEGDYIVLTIPTEELTPVIDLKSSMRWNLDLSKVFKDNSFWDKLLNPISSETFVRIEENSKEPDTKQIYLFHFSSFLNDSTTIRGTNLFQEDLYLFRSRSDLSFRFRFIQRKSLNQYSTGLEKGFFRERSLRIKFRMVEEINNQTEIINQTDNLIAPSTSNRSRLVTKNTFSTDFSYRPTRYLEFGLKVSTGQSRDDLPEKPTIIDINSQLLRFTLSFAGLGRLRIEAERNELNTNTTENYIPFEITQGNFIGKNYYWRLNFDYRITGNLQTTVSYDGRLQGGNKAVHTMRAEARAYF